MGAYSTDLHCLKNLTQTNTKYVEIVSRAIYLIVSTYTGFNWKTHLSSLAD